MTHKPPNKSESKELGHKLLKERVSRKPNRDNKDLLSNYESTLKRDRIEMSRS